MDYSWLAGGGVLAGVLIACWNHLKGWGHWLTSRVFQTVEVCDDLRPAVRLYLRQNYTPTQWGDRRFHGWNLIIRSLRKRILVALEAPGSTGVWYQKGWQLIHLHYEAKPVNQHSNEPPSYRELRLSFFRYGLNIDEFISASVAAFNAMQTTGSSFTRHSVYFHFGSAGKPINVSSLGDGKNASDGPVGSSSVPPEEDARQYKLLGWTHEDLGQQPRAGDAIAQMALDSEASALVTEIRDWLKSEAWFIDRGVPWKMGCLLHGAPGNGKTALVRALGEDLDLPVHVFDLASFFNDELREEWSSMLRGTPCIALFEDIDAVFRGRENISGGSLTFDSLLNVIDGVSKSHGLLLFLTTNKPQALDEALCSNFGEGIPSRPSRVDWGVEMGPPTHEGRLKIIRRILADNPELWAKYVGDTEDLSGAQVQYICQCEATRQRRVRSKA